MERIQRRVSAWLARYGVHVMRVALGVVFLWLGALKFFPGVSPAEPLIHHTVEKFVEPDLFIPVLAAWECAIGLGLILRRFQLLTLTAMLAHMSGTFLPLVVCPEQVWSSFPLVLTVEGQYILKNLVLVGAALTLLGTLPPRSDSERSA